MCKAQGQKTGNKQTQKIWISLHLFSLNEAATRLKFIHEAADEGQQLIRIIYGDAHTHTRRNRDTSEHE